MGGSPGMTKDFSLFLLMVFVWSTKGLLLGAGGPQQLYDMQRFLAARSPRSAAKAGMLWGAGHNRIKVIKRKAHGYRDMDYFMLKIYNLHTTRYSKT
jgi:hypothetical protein